MNGEIVIGTYSETDEPQVINLWQQVFAYDAPHNDPKDSIRRKLAFQNELFFVARLNGLIIGTTMAGYDGHRGWIYSVAVHPDHSRRGVGKALLNHAEHALKALDCPKINLQINITNNDVVAFYRRCGYQVEERISMGKRLVT